MTAPSGLISLSKLLSVFLNSGFALVFDFIHPVDESDNSAWAEEYDIDPSLSV
jgi:hypothetical protein